MGPSPPSRLLLGLTLFLTLTHATVTVYTPTQVVFTTAPAVSGTPAAYTGVAAYNPGTLAPPPLPTPAVLTNPIPINLLNIAMGEILNGRVLLKNLTGITGTMQMPPLPTSHFDLAIVPAATSILGPYLLGLQAGNEPDIYNLHGHRPATYGPYDYGGEISDFLT
ncbi:hypothetical protein B0H16DRAFT_1746905 [Mycena metata]|uniref:Plastocyanin-like domain-containing protein n=1 Tax=Mycena metata TaxID=1033252 RepID=A0AAD7GW78_9AGAR|nr:hypothetical protein B0H16DRAFT_1746905 [Mycena metata]